MVSKRKGETDDEFREREREVKAAKREQPSGEPGLTKGQAAARVRHR
jgi:hypothetical protein